MAAIRVVALLPEGPPGEVQQEVDGVGLVRPAAAEAEAVRPQRQQRLLRLLVPKLKDSIP